MQNSDLDSEITQTYAKSSKIPIFQKCKFLKWVWTGLSVVQKIQEYDPGTIFSSPVDL